MIQESQKKTFSHNMTGIPHDLWGEIKTAVHNSEHSTIQDWLLEAAREKLGNDKSKR